MQILWRSYKVIIHGMEIQLYTLQVHADTVPCSCTLKKTSDTQLALRIMAAIHFLSSRLRKHWNGEACVQKAKTEHIEVYLCLS